jgi:hypothetical protein
MADPGAGGPLGAVGLLPLVQAAATRQQAAATSPGNAGCARSQIRKFGERVNVVKKAESGYGMNRIRLARMTRIGWALCDHSG